jgi:hypothetical protein
LLTFEKTGKFITFILVILAAVNISLAYEQRVNNFSLYGADQDSLIVQQLAEFVTQCQKKFNQFFDINYQQKVDIYLARSAKEYAEFNQSNVPEWSSGVAYTQLRKIILKPGSYYDPGRYRETLFHEIAHMYIMEVSPSGRVPVWLNEGLSMYLSEKSISWQESIAIGNAISANNLVDLEAIGNVLRFYQAKAETAYIQSFLAVQYLVAKIGEKAVVSMLYDFSSTMTVDEVFEKHLGYSYFEFELEWFDDLKNRYRWMSWLQFENLLWFSFIVIIFLVFILKKMRNRKIIKEWEEEDNSNPEN